jgi:hypothetical protein
MTFVVMIAEPMVVARRARARFASLAAARGAAVTPGADADVASFEVDHGGRTVTVRRELRQPGRGSSYRGPRGHLLIVETGLAGTRWPLHGLDVVERTGMVRMLPSPTRSGDTAFDDRFAVIQDGVHVREGWLDVYTRQALVAFFDLPVVGSEGRVWVKDGVLQFLSDRPKTIDAAALTAVIDRQAALATALERTAGWRGPVA